MYIERQLQSINNWRKKKGELRFADFDGDGKTDLICSDVKDGKHHILLSTGVALKSPNQEHALLSHGCLSDNMDWVDFNGDNKADFTCRAGSGDYNVLLSNGINLRSPNKSERGKLKISGDYLQLSKACTKENTEWVDFNGDGKTDLFYYTKSDYYVLLSTGHKLNFQPLQLSGRFSNNNAGLSWVDFNRDKLADLTYINSECTKYEMLLGGCELL